MRDDVTRSAYRIALVTLDSHAAGPALRACNRLADALPGLSVSIHAAAEWAETPAALEEARAAVRQADLVVVTLLFLEEHLRAILPDLQARRASCDAMICCISAPEIVRLTRMGDLDMSVPSSAAMKLLKSLRGSRQPSGSSAERQMSLLRRLPKMLRFIPGKAQDLRAWFLTMQYWLGGSDDNFEAMLRFLVGRYAQDAAMRRGGAAPSPVEYPEVGLYHPALPGRVALTAAALPPVPGARGTVGLLLMRSYVLASDTAHYDAVIRALEAEGLRVLPAFAAGLDGRPAIDAFLSGKDGVQIDALVSLTGFSLVGGPAYNDNAAAVETLSRLDVPYIAAQPLEFQTLGQWGSSAAGLGPVETTMMIALPEIDGAANPTVFAGRLGPDGCRGCALACQGRTPGAEDARTMAPCLERVARLAARVARLVRLRRSAVAERRVAITLYGFPPNAGAVGTAAYLSVFESLFNVLTAMRGAGYRVELPASVEALRAAVLEGNAARHGQPANVLARVETDTLVRRTPWLSEIEAVWGAAPGRQQSDGRGVFVLGASFGNVMVGVQPAFGYEGDPMRLLFEKGFAPTHAFTGFYQYLTEDFGADAVLHFGMHGALEFMPGKQSGPGAGDWPDRLIGTLPNVYLYAANNPSEATLAKRRSGAVMVTHLTPPLTAAGLYKGLAELKDSLATWRALPPEAARRDALAELIAAQAEAVDLGGTPPDLLWARVLEVEEALITDGLHVVGRPMSPAARADYLRLMPEGEARDRAAGLLARDSETPALLRALAGRYIAPVPGGDLVRAPEILPTGRNIHAFDPFRMPTAFAMVEGARQAGRLIAAAARPPRSVAMVLWGSDNIKSDGGPIAQAMALIGARPRFDSYGRLGGAELVPLAELGRPRIDVVMTLSGIFRDLLPLQTRMLAEAAWLAATADEPEALNSVRAHALAYVERAGCDLATAALRVFSNAEGTYGSNVNMLVDSGAWNSEDELADAYQARKCFAYGRDGKPAHHPGLLGEVLRDVDLAYQNLESVELGVTSVDHYFDTLGGIARAAKRARGADLPVFIGDQTRGEGKVRSLSDQIALETRSRTLNPKFYEGLLRHGAEGVRQIEAHVTNTMGWSATAGRVEPWVYQRLTETFVLDPEMRRRIAALNPQAGARLVNRLIEAHERNYWHPDAETMAALQAGAEEVEDALEGVTMAAE